MHHRARLFPLRALVVCALATSAFTQQSGPPGAALTKGMRLVYGSGGAEQPAWVVDSVDFTAAWQATHTPCSYIRFGASDVRRLCQARDTVFAWNEAQGRLVATRPVGPHMSLRITGSSGGYSLFETADATQETVSGQSYRVLPTTVTTYDANGRVLRRLRERYAPDLATALGGIFEVPDSTSPGRWLVQREFALLRIEMPGQ